MLPQNYQHFLEICILSKMSKKLKNGIEILVGESVSKVRPMDQNSQNIVLINNSRTAWPT